MKVQIDKVLSKGHKLSLLVIFSSLFIASVSWGVVNATLDQLTTDETFQSCGVMSGGLVEFLKHRNGDLVNKFLFTPKGSHQSISLDYPSADIGVYPNLHSNPCKAYFDKPPLYVIVKNQHAKTMVERLLEHHLTLTEEEQRQNMLIQSDRTDSFGYFFARGISCEFRLKYPGSKEHFQCYFFIQDDLKSTVGSLLRVPKPRMGAGNASVILKQIRAN